MLQVPPPRTVVNAAVPVNVANSSRYQQPAGASAHTYSEFALSQDYSTGFSTSSSQPPFYLLASGGVSNTGGLPRGHESPLIACGGGGLPGGVDLSQSSLAASGK